MARSSHPVIGCKLLAVATVSVFCVQRVSLDEQLLLEQYGASWSGVFGQGEPWRLFTSMFCQPSTAGFGLSIVGLAGFGLRIERLWGVRRIIFLYLGAGVVATLLALLADRSALIVGTLAPLAAMAAVYWLLFPDVKLAGIFSAGWGFAGMLALIALSNALRSGASGAGLLVVEIPLVGALLGWLHVSFETVWQRFQSRRELRRELSEFEDAALVHHEVDRLLDKIHESGFESLSEAEKGFLEDASLRYRRELSAQSVGLF